jgi:hypothetical protein
MGEYLEVSFTKTKDAEDCFTSVAMSRLRQWLISEFWVVLPNHFIKLG